MPIVAIIYLLSTLLKHKLINFTNYELGNVTKDILIMIVV